MEHRVIVVEDDALTEPGWAMASDGREAVFIVRQSSAADAQVLTDAWEAARAVENRELAAALTEAAEDNDG